MAVVTMASFGRSQRPDTMGSQDTAGLVGVTFEGVVGRDVWISRVSRELEVLVSREASERCWSVVQLRARDGRELGAMFSRDDWTC